MGTKENVIKLENENIELRKLLKDIIDNDNPNNYISPCMNREHIRLNRFIDKIKAAKEYLSCKK